MIKEAYSDIVLDSIKLATDNLLGAQVCRNCNSLLFIIAKRPKMQRD